MQITFSNSMNFTISQLEKQRIESFCEISGEHKNVVVKEAKHDDDLKSVAAFDLDTEEIISYFDVTDENETISYML